MKVDIVKEFFKNNVGKTFRKGKSSLSIRPIENSLEITLKHNFNEESLMEYFDKNMNSIVEGLSLKVMDNNFTIVSNILDKNVLTAKYMLEV